MISAIEQPRSDYIQSALLCEDEFSLGQDSFYDTYRQRLSGVVSVFRIGCDDISIRLIRKDGGIVNSYTKSDRLPVHRDIELFKGCSIDIANYQGKVKEVLKVENSDAMDNLKWQIEKPDSMDVVCDSEIKVFGHDDNFGFKHLLTIEEPCLWDSTGKTVDAEWKLGKDDRFELKIWGDIVFPLYIDPVYTIDISGADLSIKPHDRTSICIDSSGVWWAIYTVKPGKYLLNIAKSTDAGQTWTSVYTISDVSYSCYYPSIVMESDVLYIVYYLATTYGLNKFARFGTQTETMIEENTSLNGTYRASIGSVTLGMDRKVHITISGYTSSPTGKYQVLYKTYNIATSSFSGITKVSTTSVNHFYPQILEYSPGKFLFGWLGDYVSNTIKPYYRFYDSRSNTWSAQIIDTDSGMSGYNNDLSFVYDSERALFHIVWPAGYGQNNSLYYRTLSETSKTLSEKQLVELGSNSVNVLSPHLFWNNDGGLNCIYPVSPNLSTGDAFLYHRVFDFNTGSWADKTTLLTLPSQWWYTYFRCRVLNDSTLLKSGYASIYNITDGNPAGTYLYKSDDLTFLDIYIPAKKAFRPNYRNRRRSA